jgi:hypothetical protein
VEPYLYSLYTPYSWCGQQQPYLLRGTGSSSSIMCSWHLTFQFISASYCPAQRISVRVQTSAFCRNVTQQTQHNAGFCTPPRFWFGQDGAHSSALAARSYPPAVVGCSRCQHMHISAHCKVSRAQKHVRTCTSRVTQHFDARCKTDSRVDPPAQRTERGECWGNTVQTCQSLLRHGRMLKSGRSVVTPNGQPFEWLTNLRV